MCLNIEMFFFLLFMQIVESGQFARVEFDLETCFSFVGTASFVDVCIRPIEIPFVHLLHFFQLFFLGFCFLLLPPFFFFFPNMPKRPLLLLLLLLRRRGRSGGGGGGGGGGKTAVPEEFFLEEHSLQRSAAKTWALDGRDSLGALPPVLCPQFLVTRW